MEKYIYYPWLDDCEWMVNISIYWTIVLIAKYIGAACDKFEPLFLSESGLSGQNMSLRGWSLVGNLFNVRPVSVQVLKEQKMPFWDWEKMQ